MKRRLIVGGVLGVVVGAAFACQGPPAEDAAICQDIVNRLCAEPLCDVVTEELKVGASCLDDLAARAGCGSEGFAFGEQGRPTRERILECRLPLVRGGDSTTRAPTCDQVEESFLRCPDFLRFFDGGVP